MLSRPAAVCAMIRYHPLHVLLTTLSALLGATNPLASAPGTIRGDYAIVSREGLQNHSQN